MATKLKAKVPLTNRKPATKKGENEISSSKMFHIPVGMIDVEPEFNQRIDYGTDIFEELKDSIAEHGVEEPIRVIPHPKLKGRFYVREGHRRMEAVKLLLKAGIPIKKVPAIIVQKENTEQSLIRMLSSNNGKPFTNIEMGLTFQKLKDFGWSVTDIAKKTGFKENKVYFCMSLTQLPKKYHKLMAQKLVQESMLVDIFRKNDNDAEKAEKEIERCIKNKEKEQGERLKEAKKEAKAKGKDVSKVKVKEVKLTAKHLSTKSGLASPLKVLEDAIIQVDKKPEMYDQKLVLAISTIFECITNKGTTTEVLAILQKKK